MPVRIHPQGEGEFQVQGPLMASPVMVGRTEEWNALLAAVARPPAVVLVEGEAGVGKTRLVREVTGHPAIAERRVLAGACHPIREPFPYGPVFELLRHAQWHLPSASELNPVTGSLRAYLPELAEQLPAAPEPLPDARLERHRLFRAVRELMAALGPSVVVIEDLHWADDGSRDLLRFLIDELPKQTVLVLTYRREELPGAGLPLGRAYRHPAGVSSVVIDVAPLDVDATGELAAALLARSTIEPDLASLLHDRTAGVPFVLEEVLSALPAEGDSVSTTLTRESFDAIEVPLLVREAMVDRMAGLSSTAADAVRVAAVLRKPVAEAVIREVAGGTVFDCHAAAATKEALQAGILREFDDGCYGFRHALAQQAVYDTLSGPDRRELHSRAVEVLQGHTPKPLVQLAYHARHAGRSDDWLHYSEKAADRAAILGDNAIAIELLEDALDGGTEAPQEPVRGRLAVKLSRVAITGLGHRRAAQLLRRILRLDDLPKEVRGEVRLNLGLLRVNQAGDNVGGRADMEVAVAELRQRPALAARGMAALALPAWGLTPIGEHEQWIERAERLVSDQDDPALAMAVRGDRIALRMAVGDATVWTEVQQLPSRARSVPERHQLARAFGNLAEYAAWLGKYAEADRFQREGRSLAVESGAPFLSGAVDGTRLRLDWVTGHWQGLHERATHMLEITSDTPWLAADAQLVLGQLAIARGDWEEADTYLHACGLAAPDDGAAPVVAAASASMLRLLVAHGQTDKASSDVDLALSRVRSKGVWVWAAELAPAAVAALVSSQRFADAGCLIGEFADGVAGSDAPLATAALDAANGVLAGAYRRYAEAAEAFDRAQQRYAQLPRPYSALRAGEAAVRSRIAAGEVSAMDELVAFSEELAALGATRDAARCRRVLRDHGVITPSPRGRRGYGAELSPREKEVAQLLAKDRTNREIANVLFLSTRTVENHVAQVLRKLEVSSRGAVGQAVVSED